MSKRLNGTSKKDAAFARDPLGWYVEEEFCVEQLFASLNFDDDLIWDPSCGRGTILDVAKRLGHPVYGSDIVDRYRSGGHPFKRVDFLRTTLAPGLGGRLVSIVNNSPYNEPEPMIAERFVEHAIRLGGWHRAAFLVPVEFQCGQRRYSKFYAPEPSAGMRPSHIVSLMERPSMPPGAALEKFGESCRGGGMQDYIWVVFTAHWQGPTVHLFAKPTKAATLDNSTRRVRAGRKAASALTAA
jgi:hypothetical protein